MVAAEIEQLIPPTALAWECVSPFPPFHSLWRPSPFHTRSHLLPPFPSPSSSTDSTTCNTPKFGESSGATPFFAFPLDVLTHILSLLDGSTLTSDSCTPS
ncbi:hypothetical protein MRB53_019877 [Persea americana]|uniref:Uncharacterized protein n=1 Tax=Persea americana TaxID=3435 RepID=A0ACC2KZW1_PERAE|nr:hypothetical protein MRB53_019877 [Persea americana]